jgi:large subunit ribosomal protein L10
MEKLGRAVKQFMKEELSESLGSKQNVVVTNFSKLSVGDMMELRRSLKQNKNDYVVIKNSIARMSLKELKLEDLLPLIDGSVGILYGDGDIVEASKSLVKFSKDHEGFGIKGGLLEGQFCDTGKIERISKLPSRDQLIAQALATMKAPISNFVSVLKNTTGKLVYCVMAIKEKKEKEEKGG